MERTKKQRRRNRLLAGSLTVIFLLAVSGMVAQAVVPPAERAAEVKSEAKKEAEQKAALPDMTTYRYDPKGKIDPFKPFVRLELPTSSKQGSEKRRSSSPFTPLQRVSLDKVRVAGIAGAESKRVAMIEDSGGKGYIVSVGTLIGMNGGRVIQILSDRVIVEEKVENNKSKEKSHRVALKLHKEEGEGRP